MHLVSSEMRRGVGLCCLHCGFMPFLPGCFSFSPGLTRKSPLGLKHVLKGSFIRTSEKFQFQQIKEIQGVPGLLSQWNAANPK